MNRRKFLHRLGQAAVAAPAFSGSFAPNRLLGETESYLTPAKEIEARVKTARPLLGGKIPADLARRLGATHYDGQYSLTQEPFLLEGCHAVQKLGMKAIKLWLGSPLPGYGYHSEWNWKPDMRLVDVARHPYFRQAFDLPFSTFALEIQPVTRAPLLKASTDFAEDEQQFYELATYLFQTYRQRDVTFLLQHWEGDWMLRGSYDDWKPGGPPDIDERCNAMVRWLTARQRGVTRARSEFGPSTCRVFHAAEVNKVLDSLRGIPTLTTRVLPQVALDFISWSSYDGMNDPVTAWQGLDLIQHYALPAPGQAAPRVFIGELGLPEQGRKEQEVIAWWDVAMGVLLAREIPHIFHWELYCNEPIDGKKDYRQNRQAAEMRGFWLMRPDGSMGFAAKYLKTLLDHAGQSLPETIRNDFLNLK